MRRDRPASTTCRVMSMSAAEGVGSPEGWLCTGLSETSNYRINLMFLYLPSIRRGRGVGAVQGFEGPRYRPHLLDPVRSA
jgi:hypothetical protein